VQVDAVGAPEHASDTVPVKPLTGERLSEYVAVPPAVTVAVVAPPEAAAKLKSVPVPDRATVWGLPVALSVMVTVPLAAPAAVGEKVTLIVQVALAAIDALVQELVSAKPALAATALTVKAALPLLVTVTVCALLVVPFSWLPKEREVGDKETPGPVAAVPVPVTATVWGLPGASSVKVSEPVLAPAAVGVKITLIVQVAPTASEPPQLLAGVVVAAKSPPAATLVTFSVAIPEFVSVTVCAALGVPTAWLANVRLEGVSAAKEPVAVTIIPSVTV